MINAVGVTTSKKNLLQYVRNDSFITTITNRRRAYRLLVHVNARLRSTKWFPEGFHPDGKEDDNSSFVTFFGSDGSITSIPTPLPHRLQQLDAEDSRKQRPLPPTLPTPEEQGLCIPSIFNISATNGIDTTRRVSFLGFCQSPEFLLESVEVVVADRGGEVFKAERKIGQSGIQECLKMNIALPFLFGVPPQYEKLKRGIRSGGGIIDRVYREWLLVHQQ